ncbi:hypothetical protein [Thalassobacillus devorans]|nr:hypothetical protein [Thalassobacillus devorans]
MRLNMLFFTIIIQKQPREVLERKEQRHQTISKRIEDVKLKHFQL